jgi:hypothetical protein
MKESLKKCMIYWKNICNNMEAEDLSYQTAHRSVKQKNGKRYK